VYSAIPHVLPGKPVIVPVIVSDAGSTTVSVSSLALPTHTVDLSGLTAIPGKVFPDWPIGIWTVTVSVAVLTTSTVAPVTPMLSAM
jgi:hypothetical protein